MRGLSPGLKSGGFDTEEISMQNSISGSAASLAQSLAGVAAPTTSTTTLLSGVANLLGTTTDDLIARMQGGESLSDLAAAQGVSREDLLASIRQGLQANQLTSRQPADLDAMAARVADRKSTGTHRQGGGGIQAGSESLQQRMADLSTSLGVSDDELVQALQSGFAPGSGAVPGYGVSAALLQGLQIDQLA
jgi:hypothetical protein